MQYTCHPMVAHKLIEREVLRLREYIKKYGERKIAIFAAGNYGQLFFKSLRDNFGVKAEFFLDNNQALSEVGGVPVLFEPWKTDPDFAKKYFILIATKPLWVNQISSQLNEVGISHISADAYAAALLWEKAKDAVRLLDDDYSRASYLGLIWYYLTQDSSLSQISTNQYFGVEMFFSPVDEIIADIGAYVGDTVEEYIRRGFGKCKIYAFEPDDRNIEALGLRLKRLKSEWCMKDTDLIIVKAGANFETGDFCFKSLEKSHDSCLSDFGEKNVKVYALDDFFKDKQPPTIIKADIEGAEQDMLRGARGIIKDHKPKMAISIYHSPFDSVKIIETIREINNTYIFSVRTHMKDCKDTVLYCY